MSFRKQKQIHQIMTCQMLTLNQKNCCNLTKPNRRINTPPSKAAKEKEKKSPQLTFTRLQDWCIKTEKSLWIVHDSELHVQKSWKWELFPQLFNVVWLLFHTEDIFSSTLAGAISTACMHLYTSNDKQLCRLYSEDY